jgi:ubiquitin-conjugating enzyme E2 Q
MDEAITESFFRWVEENESDFEHLVVFESCENQILLFSIDDIHISINFKSNLCSSKSKVKHIKKWTDQITISLQAKPEDLFDFFCMIFPQYTEFKEFSSSEENSEDDYHQQIQEVIIEDRAKNTFSNQPDPGSSLSFYKKHFIYSEAEESIELLRQTMKENPKLRYSLNIRSNKAFCNVRLEIDLAFLSISESVMVMLGLNYESPLVVSCSISDIRLSQTLNESKWTPSLLGFLEFEVMQSGFSESYGCKTYIKGRVNKFREYNYNLLNKTNELGSYLSLSRENSEEIPKANPSLLQKLLGLGYGKKKVQEALEKSKNDEQKAVDLLMNDTNNYAGGENIIPSNNFFYNLLFYLRDRIQNCTNYCYICYKRHNVDSVRLRPCSAEICEFRFEEISGVSLYAEICNNPDLVALDLSFASESALSGRNQTVFEPFPSFLLKKNQIRGKAGFLSGNYSAEMDTNKDIQKLRELASHMPDIRVLKSLTTDELTCRDYISSQIPNGIEVYKLMRYIIATNRLNLIPLKEEDCIQKLTNGVSQYIVTNHPAETIKNFEAKKKKRGSFFAFHGSSIENWYSILRNGIRNLSNTHLMTAGAAYGSGVYCAENFSTSIGYCRFGANISPSYPHSILLGKACMAIIEVIKNEKFIKGSGIYVVQNDKDIIIRYILILSSIAQTLNTSASELGLEKHYPNVSEKYLKASVDRQSSRIEKAIKKAKEAEENQSKPAPVVEEEKLSPEKEKILKDIEEKFSGQGSITTNKRLMQEYKYLVSSKDCKGITVEFRDSNLYVWDIKLDVKTFEIGKQLRADFKEYCKKYKRHPEIAFEMRFDSNYPFSPPFLRVIRPRFAFRTGHVTVGGSICMQSITRSGWIPVRTVESIFIEILFNMAEGGARLDLNGSISDYGFEEAKEAFNRVAQQHGWT